ncbi:MAG: ribosome maturation factor RimM [Oscillospiraceae bacterium]|nr:ribosome maturation factor RimM [Oscillospiraceae bacterium]
MKQEFLETGKIVATHGVAGEVRVYPWCDSPDFLLDFDTLYLEKGKRPVQIENARLHKNVVILKIAGVGTMDEALRLRDKILYVKRSDVPLEPGEYFVQDLMGLRVVDADSGEEYGILSEVSQTGANDVYHIQKEGAREKLIPAISDVVVKTDVDGGVMLIRPLKGLFDDED